MRILNENEKYHLPERTIEHLIKRLLSSEKHKARRSHVARKLILNLEAIEIRNKWWLSRDDSTTKIIIG